MPDRYDKAVCSTELKLRGSIFTQIRSGWRPQRAFEVQPDGLVPKEKKEAESSSEESTSATSIPSVFGERMNDISDLWENKPLNFEDYV